MKKFLLAVIITLTSLAATASLGDMDGCYLLYSPGTMYPSFCFQGTNEEGISGAGAKLAIFGTNTNQVIQCLTSSGIRIRGESFSFQVNGKDELVLKNLKTSGDEVAGEAVIGSTQLKFVKLRQDKSDELMAVMNSSKACH